MYFAFKRECDFLTSKCSFKIGVLELSNSKTKHTLSSITIHQILKHIKIKVVGVSCFLLIMKKIAKA